MFVEEKFFFKNGNCVRVNNDKDKNIKFSFLYAKNQKRCMIEVFGKRFYYLILLPFDFPIQKSTKDFNIAFEKAVQNRKKRCKLKYVKANLIKEDVFNFYVKTIEKIDILRDIGL